MKYFVFRVYTPFVGEEADVYIAAETKDEAVVMAAEACNENGLEWMDEGDLENYDMNEEDYFEQCHYTCLGELTREQYEEYAAEGEWCI